MKNKIYILGAGGLARVTLQIIRDLGQMDEIKGFLVNCKSEITSIDSIKIVEETVLSNDPAKHTLVAAIGTPLRKKWIVDLETRGYRFINVVHPSSLVSDTASIGQDIVVCSQSVLNCNVIISNHVFISSHVALGHDVKIGEYVTISPGVHIGGNAQVGSGTFVGIGSTIIQKIKIGKNVLIGAGSVVVEDVPDSTLVYGNPARPIRKMNSTMWEKFL